MLFSQWTGESEKTLQEIFASKAGTPCILFFDEIDALAPQEVPPAIQTTEHMVSLLLSELDGLEELKVMVLAATNRIDTIDQALLRRKIDYIWTSHARCRYRADILKIQHQNNL